MVKLLTRPSCGKCPTAKYWLKKNDITFEEVNLDNHPEIEARMTEQLGYKLVPMVEFQGQFIPGLDFSTLGQLLRSTVPNP